MVASWPERITAQGQVRSQYHHVIDVMPTLLAAARVQAPKSVDGIEQQPIDGTSMVYSFNDGAAPSTRTTQYYEVNGNRGIYHDGWLANTTPRNMPWNMPVQRPTDTSTYAWELYNLTEDFSQTHNVADKYPDKLKEMQALFDAQARQYNVYPIQDAGGKIRGMRRAGKDGVTPRTRYGYWGPDIQMQMGSAPPIFFLPFSVAAEVEIPGQGGEGVVFAAGSKFGGWSFYLEKGVPVVYASVSGLPLPGAQTKVSGGKPLAPGKHLLGFDFTPAGAEGGDVSISVDGNEIASGPVQRRPLMLAGNGETIDTGRDTNVPVSPDYQHEGVFNGIINKVEVEVKMPGQPE
jgi:arylsulfatase